MHLGIAQQSGLIYEGVNAPDLPSIPLPTVTQAKLIESEADWNKLPNHLIDMPMSWVFREDSFDAVTRVRRGRLYEPSGTSQPVQFQVSPHPYEDPMGVRVSPQGRLGRELFVRTIVLQGREFLARKDFQEPKEGYHVHTAADAGLRTGEAPCPVDA